MQYTSIQRQHCEFDKHTCANVPTGFLETVHMHRPLYRNIKTYLFHSCSQIRPNLRPMYPNPILCTSIWVLQMSTCGPCTPNFVLDLSILGSAVRPGGWLLHKDSMHEVAPPYLPPLPTPPLPPPPTSPPLPSPPLPPPAYLFPSLPPPPTSSPPPYPPPLRCYSYLPPPPPPTPHPPALPDQPPPPTPAGPLRW